MERHATAKDPYALTWATSHTASYSAYNVSGFVPGSRSDLTANPGYWGPKPYYTNVVIQALTNSSTAVEEVHAGQAQHTSAIPWPNFASIVKTGAAHGTTASILGYGSNVEAFYLVEKYKPLANVLVRRALNVAINSFAAQSSNSTTATRSPIPRRHRRCSVRSSSLNTTRPKPRSCSPRRGTRTDSRCKSDSGRGSRGQQHQPGSRPDQGGTCAARHRRDSQHVHA